MPLRFRERPLRLFLVKGALAGVRLERALLPEEENEKYLDYLADMFDLKKDVQFNPQYLSESR
jgi:hypothetical protein